MPQGGAEAIASRGRVPADDELLDRAAMESGTDLGLGRRQRVAANLSLVTGHVDLGAAEPRRAQLCPSASRRRPRPNTSSSCSSRRPGVSSPSEPAEQPAGPQHPASSASAWLLQRAGGDVVQHRQAGRAGELAAGQRSRSRLASRDHPNVAAQPASPPSFSARASIESTAVTRAASRRSTSVVSRPGRPRAGSSPSSRPSRTQGAARPRPGGRFPAGAELQVRPVHRDATAAAAIAAAPRCCRPGR